MLAAIGFLLILLDFPILPGFTFLKVDFSDIPTLVGMYLFGPVAGITVAFIRSLLHLLATGAGPGNLIGDTMSFLSALAYTLPIYYLTKGKSYKKQIFLPLAVGTFSLTVVMSVFNYYVAMPLYLYVMNYSFGMAKSSYILMAILPFNLLKGIIISGAFAIAYAKLLPWLETKRLAANQ